MHSAASVAYPVARSRRVGQWLGVLCIVGVAPVIAWSVAVPASFLLRCGLWLWTFGAVGGAAFWWWSGRPCTLVWDGLEWRTEPSLPGVGTVGDSQVRLFVSLDLQSVMLLRLCWPVGGVRWIVADRTSAPRLWHGLRCAVTASAFSASTRTTDGMST